MDLVGDAFALIRHAAQACFGIRLGDGQLIGGWAALDGHMAEMGPGEGKTLAAVLAAATAALAGRPSHVICASDALARRHGERMTPLYEALGRKAGTANQYGNLGFLYKNRGDLSRAEEMYRKSLEIEEAMGRKEGIASLYGNLGNLYHTLGDLDRAEEMYRKSLEIEEALGSKEGMASNFGNLGNVYANWRDFDRAEDMYRKSLKLHETLGSKEGMASQYGNLGILFKTKGEPDRAQEMYRKSLDLFREIGAAPEIEHVEGLLAKLREVE